MSKTLFTGLAILAAFFLVGCETMHYGPGAGAFHTVVVDPGHGSHDRGARAYAGQPEKVLALDISKRVANELKRAGFHVIMTRNSDVFIPLHQRVMVSNQRPDSIFVSIHLNWAKRRGASGVETYYYATRSRRLAANIQTRLANVSRSPNRGVKFARYHVLRNNRRPAVLVECGFVSNPSENRRLQTAAHRQRIAEAIARGIIAERQGRRP